MDSHLFILDDIQLIRQSPSVPLAKGEHLQYEVFMSIKEWPYSLPEVGLSYTSQGNR